MTNEDYIANQKAYEESIAKLSKPAHGHVWTGCSNRVDYGTGVEYVRYCVNCGYEDPGEGEIPPCECP